MEFKHHDPEEQSSNYDSAWHELKARHGVAGLVRGAGLFSVILMLGNVALPMLLLTIGCASAAVRLSKRFVRSFRCPRCGHEFFNPRSSIDLVAARLCNHCGLKLWSTEQS